MCSVFIEQTKHRPLLALCISDASSSSSMSHIHIKYTNHPVMPRTWDRSSQGVNLCHAVNEDSPHEKPIPAPPRTCRLMRQFQKARSTNMMCVYICKTQARPSEVVIPFGTPPQLERRMFCELHTLLGWTGSLNQQHMGGNAEHGKRNSRGSGQ
jgi:hypothetical protein